MSTQPRVRRGVPEGGQYAEREHAEAFIDLSADLAVDRLAALEADGYVPALVTRARLDPRSRAKRDEWWNDQFVAAEYGHAQGDYRQMPDDYTPSRTSGAALSGHRRTHRMCYSGAGVKVRMPSATSIKRFEKEHGGTFDVPVSAEYNGGTIQGWVRVSRSGDHWVASGVGFPDSADVQVAEAVGAVLEARHPSLALAQVGDLSARRKARIEAAGVPLKPVDSSWIEGVGYDDSTSTMVVGTKSGAAYGYSTTRATFDAVAGSMSPGAAYNKLVKGSGRSEVYRCDMCARFTSSGTSHVCPVTHKDRTGDRYDHNSAAAAEARGRLSRLARRLAPPPNGPPAPAPRPTPPAPAPGPPATPDAAPPAPQPKHVVSLRPYDINLSSTLRSGGRRPVLDCTDGAGPLHARRGWTTDVAPALGRYTGSAYVPERYRFEPGPMSKPLNANPPAGATPIFSNGDYGPVYFAGADAVSAAMLEPELPPTNKAATHNDSPAAGAVLAAVQAEPGRYEFGGFIIGPDRTDERVSIESVHVYAHNQSDDPANRQAVIAELASKMGGAPPDELDLVDVPWRPGERAWRAWWD